MSDWSVRIRDIDLQINAATFSFLQKRLDDPEAIAWAAGLTEEQDAERAAIRDLIQRQKPNLSGSFQVAWSWVIESWESRPRVGDRDKFVVAQWVATVGPTGAVIGKITELVRPWPEVEGASSISRSRRTLRDLVRVTITSGDFVRLAEVGFGKATDPQPLEELADKLEGSVLAGLHMVERLGWLERESWIWDVRRVYFVDGQSDNDHDPDAYHRGLAPATKLLHETVTRLAGFSPDRVRRRLQSWRESRWMLFRRLWASIARSGELIAPNEVFAFLKAQTSVAFWNINSFPEIAELRALRFRDLISEDRNWIEKRIRRLPPKSLWSGDVAPDRLINYRQARAVAELHRIQVGGGQLSNASLAWLNAAQGALGAVAQQQRVDFDFPPGLIVSAKEQVFEPMEFSNTDSLLSDLDEALRTRGFGSASDTIVEYVRGHRADVVEAMLANPVFDGRSVWLLLPIAFRLDPKAPPNERAVLRQQVAALIGLALQIPEALLAAVTSRMADWLSDWASHFRGDAEFAQLWLRVWPFAVAETNARAEARRQRDGQQLIEPQEDSAQRLAFEALNTPVGYLMTAFFGLCPNLKAEPAPFSDGPLRQMRDIAVTAPGNARLQVLHHLLMRLEYMRRADRTWTDANLLQPLQEGGADEIVIWDAIARSPVLGRATMSKIGGRMADVARESSLSEQTRSHLAERVVLRVLVDREAHKNPSVKDSVVQQMLRLGGDRVRAASGRVLGIFLDGESEQSRETRFSDSVAPFLDTVWPKERTLLSRPLSNALAEIPAKSGEMFANALRSIEALLTPFDCWSLFDYGLYENADHREIRPLRNRDDAEALLRLLDLTVGSDDRAVVPYDLDKALDVIRRTDPSLEKETRFARLASLVRG